VALARALFDKKRFDDVINELAPIVRDVPDNLVAQRLMAESCLMVGQVADALAAYKMLLYFNPGDTENAKIVKELEAQAYEKGSLVLRTDPKPALPAFGERAARGAIDDDPAAKRAEWVRRIELLQGLLQKVERYRHATIT
jgi:hypothetical protein